MGLALKLAHKSWNDQLAAIRKKGIIDPDEKVEDFVGLLKRPQLVMLLLGGAARFFQRQYLLIVTDRRILLVHIPAFLVHGSGYHQHASIDRPHIFDLPANPKSEYHSGCRVDLPEGLAGLVGRQFAYVVFGVEAQRVFNLAAQGKEKRKKREIIKES